MAEAEKELKTPSSGGGRIVSMDQFRGYTVLTMFIVNFLGEYKNVYDWLKHDDTWINYADIIMPGFIFAVGFSFRLTIIKRIPKIGALKTYLTYVRRSLALCAVSIAIFGIGNSFKGYDSFFTDPYTGTVASEELAAYHSEEAGFWDVPPYFWANIKAVTLKVLKADLWETLAVIGVTQLLVLPFITLPFWARVIVMLGFGFGHAFLTHWFNWQFMFGWQGPDGSWVNSEIGLNNWMGEIWQTGGRSWDGGCFGTVSFAFAMVAGSLCYDMMSKNDAQSSCKKLILSGLGFIVFGYALSCLSCLYQADVADSADPSIRRGRGQAASPVMPDFSKASEVESMLAPLPFGPNPEGGKYLTNYWMTAKRVITLPFIVIATGSSMLLLAIFVAICDIGGFTLGFFRTMGMNPLAAYFIHEVIMHSFLFPTLPEDMAPWLVIVSLGLFLLFVWAMVRNLEKQNIYIRM